MTSDSAIRGKIVITTGNVAMELVFVMQTGRVSLLSFMGRTREMTMVVLMMRMRMMMMIMMMMMMTTTTMKMMMMTTTTTTTTMVISCFQGTLAIMIS